MAQYLKDIEFERIRGILANTFLNKEDAIVIARNSNLDLARIGFSDKSILTWDGVLGQAEIESKLIVLLSAASTHNGGIAEVDQFKNLIESGKVLETEPPVLNPPGWKESGSLETQAHDPLAETKNLPQTMLMMFDDQDNDKYERLRNQLYFFEMNGELAIRSFQSDIVTGNIKEQQLQLVSEADIIMPLISPDFFKPKNGYLSYVRSALDSNKKMVPVLLVTCLYSRVKVLQDYITLPPMGKFVDEYDNKELAYTEVANGVGKLIDNLKS